MFLKGDHILIQFLDDDPKGGPDADCLNYEVRENIRQNCHGKVKAFPFNFFLLPESY